MLFPRAGNIPFSPLLFELSERIASQQYEDCKNDKSRRGIFIPGISWKNGAARGISLKNEGGPVKWRLPAILLQHRHFGRSERRGWRLLFHKQGMIETPHQLR